MTASRRKHIPLMVKLHAALYQLGFEPHEVELDHDPALALRPIDPETGDTIPPANDPKALIWRPKAEHREKTFGRGGEKRITTAGGDIHAIAKARRLSKEHEEFRRRLTEKPPREERPKSKWPKRPFRKKEQRS
jgi:hypothetical protein